jgi:hypothetical protein
MCDAAADVQYTDSSSKVGKYWLTDDNGRKIEGFAVNGWCDYKYNYVVGEVDGIICVPSDMAGPGRRC